MEFKRCYGCMRELETPGAVCPHCGYDNTYGPGKQPSHVLPCGSILAGQYLVGRMLGQGGFGITYIGWDLKLAISVCIKEYFPTGVALRSATQSQLVLWSGSPNEQSIKDGRAGFVKEAQKAVQLRDLTHVVSVWDWFYENETAYIVMDYIKGETLKDRLVRSRKAMSERACVELLAPVMEDLSAVHARGIIHRDIKPDNIMLREDGTPILLDMGAAKDLRKSSPNGSPTSNLVVSEGFSPMEQYREHGEIGPWTDVYAMCATIYFCVTGWVLPPAINRSTYGDKVDYSLLSPSLAAVLKKGLAIQHGDRYRTMAELLNALRAAVAGRAPKSRRWAVALSASAVLLVISLFAAFKPKPPSETKSAPTQGISFTQRQTSNPQVTGIDSSVVPNIPAGNSNTWSQWSSWTTEAVAGSEAREVETRETRIVTGYNMVHYGTQQASSPYYRMFRDFSIAGHFDEYGARYSYDEKHLTKYVSAAQMNSATPYPADGSFIVLRYNGEDYEGYQMGFSTAYNFGDDNKVWFIESEVYSTVTEYRYRDRIR